MCERFLRKDMIFQRACVLHFNTISKTLKTKFPVTLSVVKTNRHILISFHINILKVSSFIFTIHGYDILNTRKELFDVVPACDTDNTFYLRLCPMIKCLVMSFHIVTNLAYTITSSKWSQKCLQIMMQLFLFFST